MSSTRPQKQNTTKYFDENQKKPLSIKTKEVSILTIITSSTRGAPFLFQLRLPFFFLLNSDTGTSSSKRLIFCFWLSQVWCRVHISDIHSPTLLTFPGTFWYNIFLAFRPKAGTKRASTVQPFRTWHFIPFLVGGPGLVLLLQVILY